MKALLRSALVGLMLLTSAPAFASPLPYINQPLDTIQAASNAVITSINANFADAAALVTGTGTTAVTVSGARMGISITGLSTAAGAVAATVTVTNPLIAAVSQVYCQPNGYTGTGDPYVGAITPAAGSFTFVIRNIATSGSLSATVPVQCFVFD